MEDLGKYKEAYLTETNGYVAIMNDSLVKLEKSPGDPEPLGGIFRVTHSLKSMAATMEYIQTAELCHAIEDLLTHIKAGKIGVEVCSDLLFESFDFLESSLRALSEGREELDAAVLIERLKEMPTRDRGPETKDHCHPLPHPLPSRERVPEGRVRG